MTPLVLETEMKGDIVIIHFDGMLDSSNISILENTIDNLINEGKTKVIYNMGGLDHITSAGIGAIDATKKRLEANNGKLCIANLLNDIEEIFEALGLKAVFKIYDSEESAIKSMG